MTSCRQKQYFFLLLFFLFRVVSGIAEPQRLIIRIREYSGKMRLYRDGKIYELLDLKQDMEFGRFDVLETEAGGTAEIELFSQAALGAGIKLSENTVCYFDSETSGNRQTVVLYLLTGGITWSAKKITELGEINIQADLVVCNLASTDTAFRASPDGSLIVLCREGKVTCTNKRGGELAAVPGNGVEQMRSGQLRSIPAELNDIDRFIEAWLFQKKEAFKTISLKNMKTYAVQYIEDLDRFNTAYVELMKHRDIFKRWAEIQRAENGQSKNFAVRDKITASPAVFKMRNVLFYFERSFYQILDYRNLYYDENMEESMIWPGYSTNDFFSEFTRHKADISWKMAQVRYIFKLYAEMSWEASQGSEVFSQNPVKPESPG